MLLQRGDRIGHERDEVLLEPRPGLRCGLVGVRERAMRVEPRGTRVARPIALSSRLGPHNRVDRGKRGARRWADTKAGTLDVAPVTPLLPEVLDTRTPLVDDEVRREARAGEQWRQRLDVEDLVKVGVARGDWVGAVRRKRVVVGNVGCEPTDVSRRSGVS